MEDVKLSRLNDRVLRMAIKGVRTTRYVFKISFEADEDVLIGDVLIALTEDSGRLARRFNIHNIDVARIKEDAI